MTRPEHHHPDCPARQATDDECRCSWLTYPELPEHQRWMMVPPEYDEYMRRVALDEALANFADALIKGLRLDRMVEWLNDRLARIRSRPPT